jgi:hypothetical protein
VRSELHLLFIGPGWYEYESKPLNFHRYDDMKISTIYIVLR